ncbi:hypothetical protein M9H77_25367 [Catharanthus roseus]|uniref:Uncharacterized protein n=1 Tax=Catharanthus roseus TaxID=4058 RepID=A0ACC0A6X9_CATRO|nr:hypothetical protein M9H77_25367 [Catharanthus roseus]
MGSGPPIDDLVESGTIRLLNWNDSMTNIQLGMRFIDKVQAISAVLANNPEIPLSNIIQEVQYMSKRIFDCRPYMTLGCEHGEGRKKKARLDGDVDDDEDEEEEVPAIGLRRAAQNILHLVIPLNLECPISGAPSTVITKGRRKKNATKRDKSLGAHTDCPYKNEEIKRIWIEIRVCERFYEILRGCAHWNGLHLGIAEWMYMVISSSWPTHSIYASS